MRYRVSRESPVSLETVRGLQTGGKVSRFVERPKSRQQERRADTRILLQQSVYCILKRRAQLGISIATGSDVFVAKIA